MGIFDRLKHKVKLKLPLEEDSDKKETAAEPGIRSISRPAAMSSGSRAEKVIVRPLLSERASDGEARGVYTFVVAKEASKPAIAKAVSDLYGVVPVSVRVANIQGKPVRLGRRFSKRSDWKKAMVTMPRGTQLSIHAGV